MARDRFIRIYGPDNQVRAFGACASCGGRKFRIAFQSTESWEPWCNRCGATWTPPARGEGSSEARAVEGDGDEPKHVVSATAGGEKLTEADFYALGLTPGQRQYVRALPTRARQEEYLAKKREQEASMARMVAFAEKNRRGAA